MKLILVIMFISLPVMAESSRAWWLTNEVKLKASCTSIFKNTRFENHIAASQLLTCAHEKTTYSKKQCEEIKTNKGKLILSYDLNKDGTAENFQTGVVKLKDSSFGRIVVISEGGKIKEILSQPSEKPLFSALFLHNDKLYWSNCMECGDQVEVIYKNGKYSTYWADQNDL